MRAWLVGLVGFGVLAAGQTWAVPVCDNIYAAANGSSSYPGTYVGAVGNTGSGDICQIGKGYSNQDPTKIGGSAGNTIIYSFNYDGGTLTIEQWVGNNGIFNAGTDWNAYFVSLVGGSPGALLGTLDVPFSSGPSFAGTLFSGLLDAGTYAIKNSVGSDFEDPQFQINFASIPAETTTEVPEPGTLSLLGAGLLGLMFRLRRRG